MMRVGLLGFTNSGKTTLFNALTGREAVTASHPYTTAQPNLGALRIADRRLDLVAALEKSRKRTPVTLDIWDLPAVRSGAIRGLGPKRDPDLLLMVLRGHDAEWVPSDPHGTDPVAQADELMVEMVLADLEVFERRRERIDKEATADPAMRPAAGAIARAAEALAEGIPLRKLPWSEAELHTFRDLAPLTLVPSVWVVNVSEDDPHTPLAGLRKVIPDTDPALAVSALLEEEVMRLDPSERDEIYQGLGLGEGVGSAIGEAVYDALRLLTFYTISLRESRAWAIPAGTTAREAAGKIHSDMERGFIRAEVASVDEVIAHGGWAPARATGRTVRVEGRDYVVRDGDVMLVRFSV